MSNIRVAARQDGSLLYEVDGTPSILPAVRPRDLLAAWDAARLLARDGDWGSARCFRFLHRGAAIDIALTDADAQSWAEAVDARAGLATRYGLSLCLRLLALVELIGRVPAVRRWVRVEAGEAELEPSLVAAAAVTPLDDDARFGRALLAAVDATWQALPPPAGTST